MPTKRVAVLGVLAFEILRAVLTDDLDPGFREDSQVGECDVLRRRNDRDGLADLCANALVVHADNLR
jgi:hypothetical protein